jgi:hypothetical protein
VKKGAAAATVKNDKRTLGDGTLTVLGITDG